MFCTYFALPTFKGSIFYHLTNFIDPPRSLSSNKASNMVVNLPFIWTIVLQILFSNRRVKIVD